jgi:hypothetical protein
MLDLCRLIVAFAIDLFRPRATVEAEILVLRQQIIVLRRGRPGRVPLLAVDRMVLGWVCRLFLKTREALAIVRPDTVVRWHCAGFRRYWRWKSRALWGRPGVPAEIRQLIREMSVANPLWGGASHTRRTGQARHRHRPDQRCQVYGAKKRAVDAKYPKLTEDEIKTLVVDLVCDRNSSVLSQPIDKRRYPPDCDAAVSPFRSVYWNLQVLLAIPLGHKVLGGHVELLGKCNSD